MFKLLLSLLLVAGPAFAGISYPTPTADQVLPSQTGNSGKVLGTNGTTSSWQAVNATKLQGVNVSNTAPTDTYVLTYNTAATQWEPRAGGGGGGAGTWLSTKWSSSNSASNDNTGAVPSIVGDSSLATQFNMFLTDIPLLDTTTQGSSLIFSASTILEPTSAQSPGTIQLYSGNSYGTGQAAEFDIYAGEGKGTGKGGYIYLQAGDSAANDGGTIQFYAGAGAGGGKVGGNVELYAGSGSGGASSGKIVLDDASGTITAGKVWTATNSAGAGHWAAGGGGSGGLPAYTAVGKTAGQTASTSFPYTTVVFDTVFVDSTSSYNTGTGTYTAPNTGTYVISAVLGTSQTWVPTDSVGFNAIVRNVTTGANISFNYFWGYTGNTGNGAADPYTWTLGPFIANLTAGDTVQLWVLALGTNMPLNVIVPQANQFIIYQVSP